MSPGTDAATQRDSEDSGQTAPAPHQIPHHSTVKSGPFNTAVLAALESLAALPDTDRPPLLPHVAALLAMEPAARTAFVSLAGPLTARRR